jgi:hypothetical protein
MAQSSDPRNSDDLSHSWRFDRPLFGSVLLESPSSVLLPFEPVEKMPDVVENVLDRLLAELAVPVPSEVRGRR